MQGKKSPWLVLLWCVLAAAFVTACSAVPVQDSNSSPQTEMTDMPETLVTEGPGEMMGETPGLPVTNMEMTDFDGRFIDMMVPHHQGAVAMAEVALERADHPEIIEMANAILSTQQDEITQMKGWKQEWYGSSDTPSMSEMPSLHDMPGMGEAGHGMDMQDEVDVLKNAAEPFDLAFIDAMIPHHQSAIDAAQLALEESSRAEIKEMAQAIMDAQQKEIDQMMAWRQSWYPDAPPISTPNN